MANVTHIEHEFEDMAGNEMAVEDLLDRTWQVHATFADVEIRSGGGASEATVTFTHRIATTSS